MKRVWVLLLVCGVAQARPGESTNEQALRMSAQCSEAAYMGLVAGMDRDAYTQHAVPGTKLTQHAWVDQYRRTIRRTDDESRWMALIAPAVASVVFNAQNAKMKPEAIKQLVHDVCLINPETFKVQR